MLSTDILKKVNRLIAPTAAAKSAKKLHAAAQHCDAVLSVLRRMHSNSNNTTTKHQCEPDEACYATAIDFCTSTTFEGAKSEAAALQTELDMCIQTTVWCPLQARCSR
jgi:hypothetical protein